MIANLYHHYNIHLLTAIYFEVFRRFEIPEVISTQAVDVHATRDINALRHIGNVLQLKMGLKNILEGPYFEWSLDAVKYVSHNPYNLMTCEAMKFNLTWTQFN
jgi:hypothetical protein